MVFLDHSTSKEVLEVEILGYNLNLVLSEEKKDSF